MDHKDPIEGSKNFGRLGPLSPVLFHQIYSFSILFPLDLPHLISSRNSFLSFLVRHLIILR